jgi:hypothetical protein
VAKNQRGVEKRVRPRELLAAPARSSTEIVEPDVRFSGKIPASHAGVGDSSPVARAKNFNRLADGTLRVHAQCRRSSCDRMRDEPHKYHGIPCVTRYSRDWRVNRMDRSQALYDTGTDRCTAVYFMPQALSDRVVPVAGPCHGGPRVRAIHKRLVAAILAVCVGVAFVVPARAQGTTGASSGIPLWLPPAAYAPSQGPVQHRQRAHEHDRHRSHTIERYHKKYN